MSDETITHRWEPADPKLTVKLERGQKGTYAWEIRYEGTDPDAVLARLREVNQRLLSEYGGQP